LTFAKSAYNALLFRRGMRYNKSMLSEQRHQA
jgi:hypothetical protein